MEFRPRNISKESYPGPKSLHISGCRAWHFSTATSVPSAGFSLGTDTSRLSNDEYSGRIRICRKFAGNQVRLPNSRMVSLASGC